MRRVSLAARLAALALLVASAAARPASAHQSSVAYSDIVVDGRDIEYTLQIASTDLFEAVGVEKDRPVTRDEARAGRDRLFAYLGARIHATSGGSACAFEPESLDLVDKGGGTGDEFFAACRLRFRCPRTVERAAITYDLFFDLDPRHQGLARIRWAGEDDAPEREQIFRDRARTVELRRDLGALDHARDYLHLGIEHIFTGYDHVAFVFGLLAVAGAAGLRRGARRILGVVTAFTLAHSVTLIASALGWVQLSPRIVEPAIALSIVYVGVENMVNREPQHRFALTFGFGLVHGFGFASVLKEIGLPQKGLLLSLVSFNVGVEIGQLVVVAAVLPLLALVADPKLGSRLVRPLVVASVAAATFVLFRRFDVPPVQLGVVTFGGATLLFVLGRRFGYDRVVRLGGSAVIAALATFWFFERVTGHGLFGGALG